MNISTSMRQFAILGYYTSKYEFMPVPYQFTLNFNCLPSHGKVVSKAYTLFIKNHCTSIHSSELKRVENYFEAFSNSKYLLTCRLLSSEKEDDFLLTENCPNNNSVHIKNRLFSNGDSLSFDISKYYKFTDDFYIPDMSLNDGQAENYLKMFQFMQSVRFSYRIYDL